MFKQIVRPFAQGLTRQSRLTFARRPFNSQAPPINEQEPVNEQAAQFAQSVKKNEPIGPGLEAGEEPIGLGVNHFSPEEKRSMKMKNLAIGGTLVAFVVGVFFYSSFAVHKHPDAVEVAALNQELLKEESEGKPVR